MNGLNLFNSGVWIIPVVLLGVIAALFWLVREWRQKTEWDLKILRGDLRRARGHRQGLEGVLLAYGDDEPEPYASTLDELRQQLEQIDVHFAELEQQHVAIHEQAGRLNTQRLEAVAGAPFYWLQLRREIGWQKERQQEIDALLDAANHSAEKLENLPWETALEARQAQTMLKEVSSTLDKLQADNVQGAAMEDARHRTVEQRNLLRQVAPIFLQADEQTVQEQATTADTIKTFEIISVALPELRQLEAQVHNWQKGQARAIEKVSALRQFLSSLVDLLENAPPSLALEPVQKRYDGLTVVAHNLNSTLNRLEVESIEPVIAEAGRVHAAAQEIEREVRAARQSLAELESLLTELADGQRTLSAQFAALGSGNNLPVQWEESRTQLTDLSRQIKVLGPARKPRAPEDVLQDLEAARELKKLHQELAARIDTIQTQHNELLALLSSPELTGWQDWMQEARQLARRVAEYAPENWPRNENVQQLNEDLRTLEADLQRLAGQNHSQSIPESGMSQRLEETRQLVEQMKDQRERLARVRARLEQIHATEKDAQDRLENANRVLTSIAHLVSSNAFLEEQAEREVERFRNEIVAQQDELLQRQRSVLEKKIKAADSAIARTESGANGWLNQLSKETEGLARMLGEKLHALSEIAKLDEPAVIQAQELLASSSSFTQSGRRANNIALDDLLAELKRRSDYWQALNAAHHRLEDLEGPLLEAQTQALEYRQYAHEYLAELEAWLRGTRGWPPTSQSLEGPQQQMARVDAQWEALKSQPIKAINLVGQLTNLANRYHATAQTAQNIAEKANQEQDRIETLEIEIEQLVQLWQEQWANYSEYPQTVAEIRSLIKEVEGDLNRIRSEAKSGKRDYQATLQNMDELRKRVRRKQIVIDEQHVIDVNGQVISYR